MGLTTLPVGGAGGSTIPLQATSPRERNEDTLMSLSHAVDCRADKPPSFGLFARMSTLTIECVNL